MSVWRIAIIVIAIAVAGAEIVRPTHYAEKRHSPTDESNINGKLFANIPPLPHQAIGSIDFVQYRVNGQIVLLTPETSVSRAGQVIFIGWCGDPEANNSAGGMFLSIDDGKRIDLSRYIVNFRPDVVKYYHRPALAHSGFRIMLDAKSIAGVGTHELQFGVLAHDRHGYYVLGGPISITIT